MDPLLCTFGCSSLPVEREEASTAVSWSGLLTPMSVRARVQSAREAVQAGVVPWAAVSVWSFPDIPEASRKFEHAKDIHGAGTNDYVLMLLPEDKYCVFRALGHRDRAQ